jgi:alpha-L-fucosidase 2
MFLRIVVLSFVAAWTLSGQMPNANHLLWYRQPAVEWNAALPIGNGRVGAMIFGDPSKDRIQFNESTVWTGEPHEYQRKGAVEHLPTIRRLLAEGRQKEAEALAMEKFMGDPMRQKAYQAFGDLWIEQAGVAGAQAYRRDLDLDSAVASVRFTANGVEYRREYLASHPAGVIRIRLSASVPESLQLKIRLTGAHEGSITTASDTVPGLTLKGGVKDGVIRFEAGVRVLREKGTIRAEGSTLVIDKATTVTLVLAAATNFVNYRDVSADPHARVEQTLQRYSDSNAKEKHVADHQRLYRRTTLDLGPAPMDIATDERLAKPDAAFPALLFHYGRYLLIASSRPGGQPANLQGIWNHRNDPPWDSKYTVNINTEMNYWPAETTNLSECADPLFAALAEVAESGARTAKEHYGARGWVLHHNFDIWRGTAPINHSNHGIWQTGGAWLARHFWERYLFTADREFLRKTAYPLMRDAAIFFVDALVERDGMLISGPSNSPEQGGLVMGPAMDHQIVRSLFGNVIAAAQILGVDRDLSAKLTTMRAKIAPNRIGKHGQLQEWLEDVDDPNNKHRHVSHLWALHPGDEITSAGTPDLFAAARKSLEFRGDGATGWSMGWKVNFWARLLDGDHALLLLNNLQRPVVAGQYRTSMAGGLYPNLFDAHPPFQIDGNFGATAGIAEMLLQSHDPKAGPLTNTAVQRGEAGYLHLLPALPKAWSSGAVRGLRARGGFTVDLDWAGGKLTRVAVTSTLGRPVTLRYGTHEEQVTIRRGATIQRNGSLK